MCNFQLSFGSNITPMYLTLTSVLDLSKGTRRCPGGHFGGGKLLMGRCPGNMPGSLDPIQLTSKFVLVWPRSGLENISSE